MSEERSRRPPPNSRRVRKRSREQMQAGPSSGSSGSSATSSTATTTTIAGSGLILPGNALGYPSQQRPSPANRNGAPQPSSSQTVIDLTDSPPPLPRPERSDHHPPLNFGRSEVIDVDALPDSPPPVPPIPRFGQAEWMGQQYDEDMALYFARDAAQNLLGVGGGNGIYLSPHRRISPPRPVEPNALYSQVGPDAPFQPRFYAQADDPMLGHGGMVGPGPSGRSAMGGYNPMGPNYPPARGVMEMLHSVRGAVPRAINNLNLPMRNRSVVIDRGFQPPRQLDYSQRAPGIIREDSPVIEDAARARNIDYKAPPPAREGFTRSPKDTDILVCPECQTELGAESTDETQEQVWASKCGHCYCGKCVHSFRVPALTKNGKKGARPKQKPCVVCSKVNLAAKSNMFKIHL